MLYSTIAESNLFLAVIVSSVSASLNNVFDIAFFKRVLPFLSISADLVMPQRKPLES